MLVLIPLMVIVSAQSRLHNMPRLRFSVCLSMCLSQSQSLFR